MRLRARLRSEQAGGDVMIVVGNCIDVLATLAADSVDAAVTEDR